MPFIDNILTVTSPQEVTDEGFYAEAAPFSFSLTVAADKSAYPLSSEFTPEGQRLVEELRFLLGGLVSALACDANGGLSFGFIKKAASFDEFYQLLLVQSAIDSKSFRSPYQNILKKQDSQKLIRHFFDSKSLSFEESQKLLFWFKGEIIYADAFAYVQRCLTQNKGSQRLIRDLNQNYPKKIQARLIKAVTRLLSDQGDPQKIAELKKRFWFIDYGNLLVTEQDLIRGTSLAIELLTENQSSQTTSTDLVYKLRQTKTQLSNGYRQHKALSRGVSSLANLVLGTGDIVDINKALTQLDGWIDRLEKGEAPQSLIDQIQGELFASLKEGGALYNAMVASEMEGCEQLLGLMQTMVEIAFINKGTRGLLKQSAKLRQVTQGLRGAHFGARGARGMLLGWGVSFSENSLAYATDQYGYEKIDLVSWTKDAVATGLAMGFTGAATQSMGVSQNIFKRVFGERYALSPTAATSRLKGMTRFMDDTSLEFFEEWLDAYTRQALDGNYEALEENQLTEIAAISFGGGGLKVGMIAESVGTSAQNLTRQARAFAADGDEVVTVVGDPVSGQIDGRSDEAVAALAGDESALARLALRAFRDDVAAIQELEQLAQTNFPQQKLARVLYDHFPFFKPFGLVSNFTELHQAMEAVARFEYDLLVGLEVNGQASVNQAKKSSARVRAMTPLCAAIEQDPLFEDKGNTASVTTYAFHQALQRIATALLLPDLMIEGCDFVQDNLKDFLREGRELRSAKDAIREALWRCAVRLQTSDVVVEIEIDGLPEVSSPKEAKNICEALTQLLHNVVKFRDKQKESSTVSIKWNTDTNRLEVTDNGIGIPSDASDAIFDKGFQVRPEGTNGVGDGLWHVREQLQSIGWTIQVESEEGVGSTFSLGSDASLLLASPLSPKQQQVLSWCLENRDYKSVKGVSATVVLQQMAALTQAGKGVVLNFDNDHWLTQPPKGDPFPDDYIGAENLRSVLMGVVDDAIQAVPQDQDQADLMIRWDSSNGSLDVYCAGVSGNDFTIDDKQVELDKIGWHLECEAREDAGVLFRLYPARTDSTYYSVDQTLPAQNQILTPQQVAYCMGWNFTINRYAREMSVLYPGMGPDVSTVLLTTDAVTVYGLNSMNVSASELRRLIDERWYDLERVFPVASRRELGVYTDDMIRAEGVELLLLLELKAMGLHKRSLRVFERHGRTEIEFDWAYPGQLPKTRRLIFEKGALADLFDDPPKHLPPFDGYYEKAFDGQDSTDRVVRLQSLLKPDAFLLLGCSPADALEDLGYDPILSPSAGDLLQRLSEPEGPMAEGNWRLYGYRRSQAIPSGVYAVAAVQNSLMSPEHTAYCLDHYARLRFHLDVGQHVACPTMATDIAPVLLATNAGRLTSSNSCQVSADRLQWFIDNWDLLDDGDYWIDDVARFIQESRLFPHLSYKPQDRAILKKHLSQSSAEGFSESVLNSWPAELFIVLALKRMGVPSRSLVTSHDSEGSIIIEFDWTHPVEGSQRRRVEYVSGSMAATGDVDGFYGKADDFLQMQPSFDGNPNAFFIFQNPAKDSGALRQAGILLLQDGYEAVAIDPDLVELMEQRFEATQESWQLFSYGKPKPEIASSYLSIQKKPVPLQAIDTTPGSEFTALVEAVIERLNSTRTQKRDLSKAIAMAQERLRLINFSLPLEVLAAAQQLIQPEGSKQVKIPHRQVRDGMSLLLVMGFTLEEIGQFYRDADVTYKAFSQLPIDSGMPPGFPTFGYIERSDNDQITASDSFKAAMEIEQAHDVVVLMSGDGVEVKTLDDTYRPTNRSLKLWGLELNPFGVKNGAELLKHRTPQEVHFGLIDLLDGPLPYEDNSIDRIVVNRWSTVGFSTDELAYFFGQIVRVCENNARIWYDFNGYASESDQLSAGLIRDTLASLREQAQLVGYDLTELHRDSSRGHYAFQLVSSD